MGSMTAAFPHRGRLWAILALAVVLRLIACGGMEWMLANRWHREFVVPGDADSYWHLAGDIADGNKYAMFEPPREVLRMPGFPALLAGFRLVGGDRLWFARLCLALVGVACCWLTYLLGKELFDREVGCWAALGSAISPALVGMSPLVLSETMFAMMLIVSLWAGVKLVRSLAMAESHDWICWSLTCGVACAGACYVRPSWLLATPGFAALLPLLIRPRVRAVCAGLLVVVAMFAALLPWAVRNQRITGHYVFTTLWMGPSLYDGLHPGATGESDMTFYDRDNLMKSGMSEFDVDRHYRKLAWSFAAENPGKAIGLAVKKLGRYWSPWPNADQFGNVALRLIIAAGSLATFGLAIAGLWSVRTRHDPWRWMITLGPVVYLSLLHLFFVGSMRYRLPAEYALLVLSAEGWCFVRGRRGDISAAGEPSASPS
jgi:4-amino-4-deoxy-L-arabinose transferase-like glycosyltransferase